MVEVAFFTKFKKIKFTEGTYKELIDFCSKLTIKQLMKYKNYVRPLKNKAYLIAVEVLKIRLTK